MDEQKLKAVELRELVDTHITIHDRRYGRRIGNAALIRKAMKDAYRLGKFHARRAV